MRRGFWQSGKVRAGLLVGFAIAAAGPRSSAQAPPPQAFGELFEQASQTYEKGQWTRCTEQFAAAARAATLDRQAARSLLGATRCATQAGDKEAALRYLEAAVARGCRDADKLTIEPDFEPLRGDPRWKALVAKVQERDAATRKGPLNAELARLYEEDQKDRAGDVDKLDWNVVGKRDEARRQRVHEIVAQGGAKEAADYVHAAMVYQHSQAAKDFKQAHDWCVKAVEIDPDYPGARWLAAAAEDRYRMNLGKPQLYGTQFRRDKDGPWYLYEVDPSVTDEERAQWDVPPLARAKARVEALNAQTFKPH